jgi:hypothetical protein
MLAVVAHFTHQKRNHPHMIHTHRKLHLFLWIGICLLLLLAIVAAYVGSLTLTKLAVA